MKRFLILVLILVPLFLSSCQQATVTVPEVEGNIDTTAASDDKADIGNKVWIDKNGDGIKQKPERGFANITVNLYKDSNSDGKADEGVFKTTKTDSGGYYQFTLLDPDINYFIEVVKPSGYLFSQKNNSNASGKDWDSDINPRSGFSDSIDVEKGRYFYWFDVALKPDGSPSFEPASLGDKVWFDENSDGVKQRTESGIAGAKVSLYIDTSNDNKPDKYIATVATDKYGNYKFNDLNPNKTYFVTTRLADYRGFSELHSSAAPVSNNLPASDWDNDLNPETGFTDPIRLVAGKYNYWVADIGIKEFHGHSIHVQIYGEGEVKSTDGSILCNQYGGKCYNRVPWGTDISLKATADSGSEFSNWVMYYLNSQYIIEDVRNRTFDHQINSHRIITAKFIDPKKLIWNEKEFNNAKWSPDGSKIVAGGGYNSTRDVTVFSASGQKLYTIPIKTYEFSWSPSEDKLAVLKKRIDAIGYDIAIYNSNNGQLLSEITGDIKGSLNRIEWSPDGTKIAAVDWLIGGRRRVPYLKIFDVASGTEIHNLGSLAFRRGIHRIVWSPNGEYVVVGSGRSSLNDRKDMSIWKFAADGTVSKVFESLDYLAGTGNKFTSYIMEWDSNSSALMTFYKQGERYWFAKINIADSTVTKIKEVTEVPFRGDLSPDGKYLATTWNDKLDLIKVVRVSDWNVVETYAKHASDVYSIEWAPDGKKLASSGLDKDLNIWKFTP